MDNYPQIDVDKHKDGTPEKVLAQYLSAWQNNAWPDMFNACQLTWKTNNNISKLKQLNGGLRLVGAEITDRQPSPAHLNAEVISDIIVVLYYKPPIWGKRTSTVKIKKVVVRMICESAPYEASVDGKWGVNPISALRLKDAK